MATQFSGCRADDGAAGAFRRMNGSNVLLKNGVRRKCDRIIVVRVESTHVGCLLLQVLGALLTAKSLLRMDPALVGSKMARRIECHLAFFLSVRVDKSTRKRLLVQMHCRNVFLESGMLSEGLFAWRILSTSVLVSSVVRRNMTTESRACHKALTATWAVTDVVPNSRVGTLHMVSEMRSPQEGLVTILEAALE